MKKFLVDADTMLMRYDLKVVPCRCDSDKKLILSGHTDDSLCFVYCQSNDEYDFDKEFAFRDWASFHSVLGAFYDCKSPNDMSIQVIRDNMNYPTSMKFVNGRLSMTYFVQNYSFLERQADLLSEYNKKKFSMPVFEDSNVPQLDDMLIGQMSKMCSVVGNEYFTLRLTPEGLFFIFGDDSQSIDSACMKVQENCVIQDYKDEHLLFSTKLFVDSVKYMKKYNEDVNINVFSNKIVISGKNEISTKVICLRGKK